MAGTEVSLPGVTWVASRNGSSVRVIGVEKPKKPGDFGWKRKCWGCGLTRRFF